MNIILVRNTKSGFGHVTMTHGVVLTLLVVLVLIVPLAFLGLGYVVGSKHGTLAPGALYETLHTEVQLQRAKVEDSIRNARANMNALALRLGQMQAQAIRLDALGDRLTKMADLDKGEFNFKQQPSMGGPESNDKLAPLPVADFVSALETLSKQLENRSQQLGVLETLLMNRNLQAEVFPAGRPVESGWISSYFGNRTDPFKGGVGHHGGIDFAGKDGSPIKVVASGVVTFAGDRSGYGNLVEVNHGNGYATRYGHCKGFLVAVGDTVKKGQEIALMGSTGRSTGPHLHFEVLRNGNIVNPREYIDAKPAELFGSNS